MRQASLLTVATLFVGTIPTASPVTAQMRAGGERMFQQSFDVGAGGTLVVDFGDGDVLIETRPGDGVEVEVYVDASDLTWGRQMFRRMNAQASMVGTTVRVHAQDPRIEWDDRRGMRRFMAAAVITVPERFNLQVRTRDGDVSVARLVGNATLESQDGNITMTRVEGSRLMVETSDGTIRADVIDVANATVRSSDGDIDLARVSGRLEASTGDGDIYVTLERPDGVDIRSADGNITLAVPEDLGADLALSGEDLDVAARLTVEGRITRQQVGGSMNGGGVMIEARTNDGTLTLTTTRR